MNSNYGLAQGITAGLKTVQDSMVQVEGIQQRRQQLQMMAEQQEMQRKQVSQNMEFKGVELEELKTQVEQLKTERTKDLAFGAFKSFLTSEDPTHLNNAVKKDVTLKSMLESKGGARFVSPTELSEEVLNNIGYGIAKKSIEYPAIVQKQDGSYGIMNMFEVMNSSGYSNQVDKFEKEKMQKRFDELKLISQEADTSIKATDAETYLKYVNSTIETGKMPKSHKEWSRGESTTGGSGIKNTAQIVAKLAELNTIPEEQLTTLQKSQKAMFKQYVETDKDETRQLIGSGLEVTNKYIDGFKDKQVTLEEVTTASEMEALAGDKPDKKTVQDLTSNYVTLKQGHKLVDKVNTLKDEELERGIVDEGITTIKSLLSDSDFNNLSPEEKTKKLQTVKFNTRLGSYLADYIRSISGTAASEAEFTRLKTILTGGTFNNTQTLKASIQEFVALEDEKFVESTSSKFTLAKSDTMRLMYQYQKEFGGKQKPTQQETTTTPSISREEAIAELKRRGKM